MTNSTPHVPAAHVLPHALVDQVRNGGTVLFLGSGASLAARNEAGRRPPTTVELAGKIAEKFLGDQFRDMPLDRVAELAISETDLVSVQEFIRSVLSGFSPSKAHLLIPEFHWKGIATTNYDLILEDSYRTCEGAAQTLSVVIKNGERIEDKLGDPTNVLYLKLHGSLTHIADEALPLILTPEQYINHQKHRDRLFGRIESWAYEFPFLFIGHSLSDSDIRAILLRLTALGEARPRSYLVGPNPTDADRRFWEARKISCIDCTLESFMEALSTQIPETVRRLSTLSAAHDHAIVRRFRSEDRSIGEGLKSFLERAVEYVHPGLSVAEMQPHAFYRGYFADWAPIVLGLDARRDLADGILSEVVLSVESERLAMQELVVVTGHAGAGKSVLMHRVAWDGGTEFGALCLFVRPNATPEYEELIELHARCQERIFLFIDHAATHVEWVEATMQSARRHRIPLTLIAAERQNEWNAHCDSLEPYVTHKYTMEYLNSREIDRLIDLLAKHRSLGSLDGMSREEQREQLAKRAGRQLLVALHEATLGKPFGDIVLDEYRSIPSRSAQSLYLTVCMLHRLSVATRAGVISRIHGIPFTEFRERLFKPLEFIVFATENRFTGDFEYRSRHPQIAEMVFERVLRDQQERFDEILRLINCLDVDYSADRDALKGLTRARTLRNAFSNPTMVRELYRRAKERAPEDVHLLQQEAIYEMQSPGGSLVRAEDLLRNALRVMPKSSILSHSLAELMLKKAEVAPSPLERSKNQEEVRRIVGELKRRDDASGHVVHTSLKLALSELEDSIREGDATVIERRVKDLEKQFALALQSFPNESHVLDAEARFATLMKRHPQALSALEKAFQANKRSPYVALRLANTYKFDGRISEAIDTLRESLEANTTDMDLNYRLARLLIDSGDGKAVEIKHLLRRSFTNRDSRYMAQFWYARLLYLDGDRGEALEIFQVLKDARADPKLKRDPVDSHVLNGRGARVSGVVVRRETSYGIIRRDGVGDTIFMRPDTVRDGRWDSVRTGRAVTFVLAFNLRGPLAIDIVAG